MQSRWILRQANCLKAFVYCGCAADKVKHGHAYLIGLVAYNASIRRVNVTWRGVSLRSVAAFLGGRPA